MRNYADVPNLHTRIYALRSRLFSPKDYAAMIRDQQALPGNIVGIPNPTEAKETLFKQQIAPIINLTTAFENYTPFFIAHLRQYETQNARLLLAKAAGHESILQWYDIGPFATMDKGLLAQKLSVDDIKAILANIYQDNDFLQISGYRKLVVHLDIRTAANLHHSADLLSGQATAEFREMMLKRIAVMTLIWQNRLKSSYRMPQEKIRHYMEGFHQLYGGKAAYRVSLEQAALDRRVEQIRKDTGREPSVMEIEHHLEVSYYAWIASMFHRDFHSIYCVVAYLWLLYYQIRNLLRIIDGKRIGLSADAIQNKMICAA